jgi:uncharacterized protein (DUF1499 family)
MDILKNAAGAVTGVLSGLWPVPGQKPSLQDGKLRPCEFAPNCVSSESGDFVHHVDPLAFSGPADRAWSALKSVLADHGGVIRDEQPGYLWSTFLIPLFGYTDDVEFRLAEDEGVIHIRSAARFGFYDLNVNRARAEELRIALAHALKG